MGRPKKDPEHQLRTVGTRVSPSLLRKVHGLMHEMKRQGKIARANESAACAWLIGHGLEALQHASDEQLQAVLSIWPDLNEVAREALLGVARSLHELDTMRKESTGNVTQIDAARDNGPDQLRPHEKKPKKPGGNGQRGEEKEIEEDTKRYVA